MREHGAPVKESGEIMVTLDGSWQEVVADFEQMKENDFEDIKRTNKEMKRKREDLNYDEYLKDLDCDRCFQNIVIPARPLDETNGKVMIGDDVAVEKKGSEKEDFDVWWDRVVKDFDELKKRDFEYRKIKKDKGKSDRGEENEMKIDENMRKLERRIAEADVEIAIAMLLES